MGQLRAAGLLDSYANRYRTVLVVCLATVLHTCVPVPVRNLHVPAACQLTKPRMKVLKFDMCCSLSGLRLLGLLLRVCTSLAAKAAGPVQPGGLACRTTSTPAAATAAAAAAAALECYLPRLHDCLASCPHLLPSAMEKGVLDLLLQLLHLQQQQQPGVGTAQGSGGAGKGQAAKEAVSEPGRGPVLAAALHGCCMLCVQWLGQQPAAGEGQHGMGSASVNPYPNCNTAQLRPNPLLLGRSLRDHCFHLLPRSRVPRPGCLAAAVRVHLGLPPAHLPSPTEHGNRQQKEKQQQQQHTNRPQRVGPAQGAAAGPGGAAAEGEAGGVLSQGADGGRPSKKRRLQLKHSQMTCKCGRVGHALTYLTRRHDFCLR